ncbi:MAG TPA: cell division FtsA domain-containing protein [Polyangiaceae bacterium]|nr:cell division FtsA domain-containing protein [Polyangiaceae bacterium]
MTRCPPERAQRAVVVDVGTTKVTVLVAEAPDGDLVVQSAREEAWDLVADGVVVDPERAARHLRDVARCAGVAVDEPADAVWVPTTALRGALATVERAGLLLAGVVPAAVASAASVCTPEEIESGVVVLDLGAGGTGLCALAGGEVCHQSVLAFGAHELTAELARGLGVSLASAEQVKRAHACALAWLVQEREEVTLPEGGRAVSRRRLSALCAPLLDDLFATVAARIAPLDVCCGGSPTCVLTGGGAALAGLVEHAEIVLGMPTRIGRPRALRGAADGVGGLGHAAVTGAAALQVGWHPALSAPASLTPSVAPVEPAVVGAA